MSTSQPDVFHAVAEPHRRVMLDLLLEKERTVSEIVEHFDLSFQGVSQHLGVLSDAGLVRHRKVGRCRYYRIDPAGLAEIDQWVGRYRRFWSRSLRRLGRHLDRER